MDPDLPCSDGRYRRPPSVSIDTTYPALIADSHHEPRPTSLEPRAKSLEPSAMSQEPRAKSQEPRAKSQAPRAKSKRGSALIIVNYMYLFSSPVIDCLIGGIVTGTNLRWLSLYHLLSRCSVTPCESHQSVSESSFVTSSLFY